MGREMKVALELQPCCRQRSGIGTYAYEISKRLRESEDIQFRGRVFDPRGKRDIYASVPGLPFPIDVCRLFPYGVYRRIWRIVPIRYDSLFCNDAELSIFFDYIVPPRVTEKSLQLFTI